MTGTWTVVCLVALFLGLVNLESARRQRAPGPLLLLLALVAGYMAYRDFHWLWAGDDELRLIAIALTFSSLSPVLGWVWWSQGGAVRRLLLRALGFILVSLTAATVGHSQIDHIWLALACGVTVATILFSSPVRRVKRWRERRRRSTEYRREVRRQQREAEVLAAQQQQRAEREEEVLDSLVEELRK